MRNKNLHTAKAEKNDEFYTQLTDIEKELVHYKDHFKDKTIYLNADDYTFSKFWLYFVLHFQNFGLKKLIATAYNKDGKGVYAEYDGTIQTKQLQGNGDFRSEECIDILKQSDIVITNPPFSLFREHVAQLVEHNKKFLVIGSIQAVKYKVFFPLLKDNKVWIGYNIPRKFNMPDSYELKGGSYVDVNGTKIAVGVGALWYTNLDINKRNEDIHLYKKYSPEEYPKYDNYDAIEVSKVANIPMDYDGLMGVPIRVMQKYNPAQFDIVGKRSNLVINANNLYERIIIKNKKVVK